MLSLIIVVLLFIAGVIVVLYQGAALVLAARMRKIGAEAAPPFPNGHRVSVVIAARNEERDLGPCLDGLLNQKYTPSEIIVVDVGSTDRTRQVASARLPRVRLIEEPPLPSGWVGKNWGCHQGAEASTGDLLLFTDSDIRYDPSVLGAAVGWAEGEHADLVSLAPRVEMVGFWENTVLPFYTQMVLTYFRASEVNRDHSKAAMANGQFFLVRRPAYRAVGGHLSVRGVVLEDVRLAQLLRKAGYRLRIGWAPELLTTRMYRDRHEMFEGLLKNIHGVRFSAWRQMAFIGGLIGFYGLPLLVLPLGLLAGSVWIVGLGAFLYVALFGKHVAFTAAARGKPHYGLLYPVAMGFYLAVVMTSIAKGISRQPITWKGRTYTLEH